MATPVAKYLVEFGKGELPASFKAQDELVLPHDFETSEAQLERRLEEAFARGLEVGREKAKAEFDHEIAAIIASAHRLDSRAKRATSRANPNFVRYVPEFNRWQRCTYPCTISFACGD
jgi:hypothetical protein